MCALQGGLDLRPGLVQFGAWWLERVAYPEFQDTGRLWLFGACFASLAWAVCSAGTTRQARHNPAGAVAEGQPLPVHPLTHRCVPPACPRLFCSAGCCTAARRGGIL